MRRSDIIERRCGETKKERKKRKIVSKYGEHIIPPILRTKFRCAAKFSLKEITGVKLKLSDFKH